MMPEGRRLLWGLAGGVDLLWLIIGALASSMFLLVGAVMYGLVFVAFLAAELRAPLEDEPSVFDDPE